MERKKHQFTCIFIEMLLKNYFFKLIFILYIIFFVGVGTKAEILLKGKVEVVNKKSEIISINLITPINYFFSLEGDKILGIIEKDIKVNNFVIPKDSKVNGTIKKINKPSSFGRDGDFTVELENILVNEKINIPIQAIVSTKTSSTLESTIQTFSYDSALITYGAAHGLLAGIQYGGIPLAITSHGGSVLAGAALGAGAGIIGSIRREGQVPITNLNRPTSFIFKSNLYILGDLEQLNTSAENLKQEDKYLGYRFFKELNKNNIEIEILNANTGHNKKYGNYIEIMFKIKNLSTKYVNLSDIKLSIDDKKTILNPDVFLSGNEVFSRVKPGEMKEYKLFYLIENKKEKYSLVLIDPMDIKEIIRIPLLLI